MPVHRLLILHPSRPPKAIDIAALNTDELTLTFKEKGQPDITITTTLATLKRALHNFAVSFAEPVSISGSFDFTDFSINGKLWAVVPTAELRACLGGVEREERVVKRVEWPKAP